MFSVYLFDEPGQINYPAAFQVFRYGDVGIIYTIQGPKFYDIVTGDAPDGGTVFAQIFRELEVTRLQGYVSRAHLVLMRRRFKHLAHVEVLFTGMMNGETMYWVDLQAKVVDLPVQLDLPLDGPVQEQSGP